MEAGGGPEPRLCGPKSLTKMGKPGLVPSAQCLAPVLLTGQGRQDEARERQM